MILDVNTKPKTLTFLEKKNRRISLLSYVLGKNFYATTPKTYTLKKKKINWISSKVKTCDLQKTVEIMKSQPRRKYLQMIKVTRNLYSKYIKNSQMSIIRGESPFFKTEKKFQGAISTKSICG